jgi:hypothetical protein
MARISVTNEEVFVHLSLPEKIGAIRGDIRFPRSAVRAVRVVNSPFAEIGGIRSPGTRIPGVVALGTWRLSGGREFVAVYRGDRGVVLDLDTNHAPFQRIVVSTKDPDSIRDLLARLGK